MLKNIVAAYWPSFRKYWVLWLVTLVGMVVSVSLQAMSPYYLRAIVANFTSPAPDMALANALYWKLVATALGIIVGFRVFDFGIALHETYAMRDLDNRSFEAIQQQSIGFFESTYSGSLITRARRFRASYEEIIDLFFFQFGKNVIMFALIAAVFVNSMPKLMWPFVGWSVLFVAYSFITAWKKFPLDKARAETDSKVGAALSDSLTNHAAVKTFGREAAEQGRFEKVVEQCHLARKRSWLWSAVIMMGQVVIMSSGELWLIGWMIDGWNAGIVSAADFVFIQTFILWAVSHLWHFGMNLRRLFGALADAQEMADIYHLTPDVQDAPGARNLVVDDGEVEFLSVRFGYGGPGNEGRDIISDLTLKVPAGQSVGIVGVSGAGKSTLLKLLLRLFDLRAGRIRIDRQDIADVTQSSLRQQLAVVPQHPQLFHRSVRDNIAFASSDASEADVIEAAKQAYAWEFIQALPEGLDTLIGERGVKLSGGQQQRIAIARAILADPRILILDEATSALDSATERQIQKAIISLLRGRTAFVIAHRLSTLMKLDRILVMEGGRVIEDGSHSELLAQGGMYAKLWNHQSGGYIEV